LVANRVFDEAIDISQISDLILAGGGKGGKGNYVATIQRVGRAIRGHKEVSIWLPYDEHHGILLKHTEYQLKALQHAGYKIQEYKHVRNIQVQSGNSDGHVIPDLSEGNNNPV